MVDSTVRVATDPRFGERRRAIVRARRRKLLIATGLVAFVAALVWLALFSSVLDVKHVKVLGARHTTGSDVREIAGLDDDDNLLLLSTHEVAVAVRHLPWVKTAIVTRSLPGTVRVRIVERKPAMIVSLGGETWSVDRTGRVLTKGAARKGLPVVGAVDIAGIQPGIRIPSDEVLAGLKAYRSLPRRLEDRIKGVFAPTVERLSFSLADGTLIRYGAAERMTAKNQVLLALLKRLAREGSAAAYLDVRVPTNPAVGPAPVPASPAATAAVPPSTSTPSPTPTPTPED